MLSTDDLDSLHGATIEAAEIVSRPNGQVLRLRLRGDGILAISADGENLSVSDESAIP